MKKPTQSPEPRKSKPFRHYAPGYGARFIEARTAANLSLSEAGRRAHIHKGSISEVEHELREMELRNVEPLAKVYGVRAEWLTMGVGPMKQGSAAPRLIPPAPIIPTTRGAKKA